MSALHELSLRLGDYPEPEYAAAKLVWDAADEIDRLTAEVARLNRVLMRIETAGRLDDVLRIALAAAPARGTPPARNQRREMMGEKIEKAQELRRLLHMIMGLDPERSKRTVVWVNAGNGMVILDHETVVRLVAALRRLPVAAVIGEAG